MALPTAQVDLTVDEFAFVIACNNEARKGIESVLQRRAEGETELPAIENKAQVFNALEGAAAKLLQRLTETRVDSEATHNNVELLADELVVSIQATFTAQKRCLQLIEAHARNGDLRKVEHGKAMFETADSAVKKMQAAFETMPKVNAD